MRTGSGGIVKDLR